MCNSTVLKYNNIKQLSVYFCILSYTLPHFLIMEFTLNFDSIANHAQWHVVKANTSDIERFDALKSGLTQHKFGKELSEILRELDTTFPGEEVREALPDLR